MDRTLRIVKRLDIMQEGVEKANIYIPMLTGGGWVGVEANLSEPVINIICLKLAVLAKCSHSYEAIYEN